MKRSDIPDVLVQQIADHAIGRFLQYRDQRGKSEEQARLAAVADVVEGTSMDAEQLYAELAAEQRRVDDADEIMGGGSR